MTSQRHCLALHLGEWYGLFSDYRPTAKGWELRGRKRSRITFEALELPATGAAIRQTNTYYPLQGSAAPESSRSWVYQDLSPGLWFFPDGSFSNGRLQLAPFSDFAVEQGFLWQERKARLVQQWDPQGRLVQVTTILERRGAELDPVVDCPTPDRERLQACLRGQWRGVARHFSAAAGLLEEEAVQLGGEQLLGSWDPLPGNLWFTGPEPLPMPTLHRDRRFVVSLHWLPEGPEGRYLLRLMREYDARGAWQGVSWMRLERQSG